MMLRMTLVPWPRYMGIVRYSIYLPCIAYTCTYILAAQYSC
jgi:hypothetical protein